MAGHGGRPRMEYDPVIGESICELLATTAFGLDDILEILGKDFAKVPGKSTVYKWMNEHPEFAERSARARELQADTLADLAMKEAQTPRVGVITTSKEWGEEIRTADNVERSKLIVQTIFKRAGQLAPKKYGEKIMQEVSGEVGIKRILVPERIATEPSNREVKPDFS